MYAEKLKRMSECQWFIAPFGAMRVPIHVFADKTLVEGMDEEVYRQAAHVAALPGVVKASCTMPDAHWGYGFPIGGVAGFDPEQGGIISARRGGFRYRLWRACPDDGSDVRRNPKLQRHTGDAVVPAYSRRRR